MSYRSASWMTLPEGIPNFQPQKLGGHEHRRIGLGNAQRLNFLWFTFFCYNRSIAEQGRSILGFQVMAQHCLDLFHAIDLGVSALLFCLFVMSRLYLTQYLPKSLNFSSWSVADSSFKDAPRKLRELSISFRACSNFFPLGARMFVFVVSFATPSTSFMQAQLVTVSATLTKRCTVVLGHFDSTTALKNSSPKIGLSPYCFDM